MSRTASSSSSPRRRRSTAAASSSEIPASSLLPAQDQILTPPQAAELLGINPGTLAHMRFEGRGPAFYRAGRSIRYILRDLIEWLRSSRVPCDMA